MHFHLPKPLHGWREFAGEVGIIVVGVLIALAAEQLAESLHWRAEVRDAKAALSQDMAQTNRVFAYRVAAHDCVARRLDRIGEIIEQSAQRKGPPSVGDVFPDIGNALSTSAWETSRAGQVLQHFDRKSLGLYGVYYMQVDNVRYFVMRENDDWGVLRVLRGNPNRLEPADIAAMRVALEHASFENDIIAGIAADELGYSKALGVSVPQPDRARLATVCRSI
ncbi:MAG TPA: hypothetical protein VFK19_04900 [Sphingomicrobium sp.]|nr:hypothetical protein [Sphingomicrobium sp.]